MQFCEQETGGSFGDQASFYQFSVDDFRTFWRLFLRWSGVIYEGKPDPVCTDDSCERASFFPNVRLSYVENLLHSEAAEDERHAVSALHESAARTG